MSTARRLLTCGSLAVVAVPALFVSVASAAAAAGPGAAGTPTPQPKTSVSCATESCTGQKPELTGCDKDGQTIRIGSVFDSTGKAVGTIEIRWSGTCQTNWARVTSKVGAQPLSATVTREDARTVAANFNGTQTWSPMVWVGATGKVVATGWIGKASGAISDGAPRPGSNFK